MMYFTRIVYLERIPFRLELGDESKKNVEVSLQHLPDRTRSLEISSYRRLVVHPVVGIGVEDQNAVSSFMRQLHCRLHRSNNDADIANQSSRPRAQAISKFEGTRQLHEKREGSKIQIIFLPFTRARDQYQQSLAFVNIFTSRQRSRYISKRAQMRALYGRQG